MSDKKDTFIVSARKYRPGTWDEVIGQESITGTLRNAIEQGHLAHAYLFCGPRGVGKTTCARIFAKEINHGEDQHDEDFAFNIFELDAASNNKVDDIRNLTDQVRIPPQVGRYKVYIIDEVHMLSTQAFNAFLKTLEEPPKHAIFILATTEKHKIIPTILSRCQIYDFNRITVEEIVRHLHHIATKEGIQFEEEALHVIGQKADGALRDALSIFDQLSSFTNRNLKYEAVLKNLHVLDYDYYFKLCRMLYEGSYAEALMLLDEVLKLGFDAGHFIGGLASHLRDLLVCQNPKTVALLEVGDAVKKQYYEQASTLDIGWIMSALKECVQTEFKVKGALNQRLLLEVSLLNIASLSDEKKNASPEPLRSTLREPERALSVVKQPVKSGTISAAPNAGDSRPSDTATSDSAPPPMDSAPASGKVTTTDVKASVASVAATGTGRKSRLVSLQIDQPAAPVQTTPSPEVHPNETPAFSSDMSSLTLSEAWKQVVQSALSEDKKALYAILSKQVSELEEDGQTMTIRLSHGVDEEEFNQHKTDVLQQLRLLCQKRDLQFSTEFTEIASDKKLFTPKEKFEHLAEKNPHLIQLKKDLDLDISF